MIYRRIAALAVACALGMSVLALPGCGRADGGTREEPKQAAEKEPTQAEKDTERLQDYVDGQFTKDMREESDAWYGHIGKVEVYSEDGGSAAICRTSLPDRGSADDARHVADFILRNDADLDLTSVKVLSRSGQLLLTADSASD